MSAVREINKSLRRRCGRRRRQFAMCAGLLLNDASALSPVGFVRRISSGREQSEWEASTGLTVNCAELLIWRAVAELLGMHTTPGIVPSIVPPPPPPGCFASETTQGTAGPYRSPQGLEAERAVASIFFYGGQGNFLACTAESGGGVVREGQPAPPHQLGGLGSAVTG